VRPIEGGPLHPTTLGPALALGENVSLRRILSREYVSEEKISLKRILRRENTSEDISLKRKCI
jgi:hypothetical protein